MCTPAVWCGPAQFESIRQQEMGCWAVGHSTLPSSCPLPPHNFLTCCPSYWILYVLRVISITKGNTGGWAIRAQMTSCRDATVLLSICPGSSAETLNFQLPTWVKSIISNLEIYMCSSLGSKMQKHFTSLHDSEWNTTQFRDSFSWNVGANQIYWLVWCPLCGGMGVLSHNYRRLTVSFR